VTSEWWSVDESDDEERYDFQMVVALDNGNFHAVGPISYRVVMAAWERESA
jgi:hypothetical protein